jgi:hypothetical protein
VLHHCVFPNPLSYAIRKRPVRGRLKEANRFDQKVKGQKRAGKEDENNGGLLQSRQGRFSTDHAAVLKRLCLAMLFPKFFCLP